MISKKLFAFVLGSLVVLALSLPVMAQSTTQSSSTDDTDSSSRSGAEHYHHDYAGPSGCDAADHADD